MLFADHTQGRDIHTHLGTCVFSTFLGEAIVSYPLSTSLYHSSAVVLFFPAKKDSLRV